MSPRRLDGWAPETVTEYVYEGDRLVGTVSITEPEFSERDVDLLLEWQHRDKDRGPHGQPLSESTSALADPNNRAGTHSYRAGLPVVDWAERARKDAEEAYRKQYKDAVPNGLIFLVEKVNRE